MEPHRVRRQLIIRPPSEEECVDVETRLEGTPYPAEGRGGTAGLNFDAGNYDATDTNWITTRDNATVTAEVS
jgi:hypothetical protein